MRKGFIIFISIFMAVFGAMTYYVGLRGWQWYLAAVPGEPGGWTYWLPFLIIALAFPLSRFGGRLLPRPVTSLLANVGAYWLLVLLYCLPLLVIIDVARAVNRWTGLAPAAVIAESHLVVLGGGAVVLVLVGLLLYGVWRARNPVVVRYTVEIPKSGGKHGELHIALVSDTHLGAINGTSRLEHMVSMVNGLDPDLVLLAGDILDDDLEPFLLHDMPSVLKRLKSRLGVYAVLGNHDYSAGGWTSMAASWSEPAFDCW